MLSAALRRPRSLSKVTGGSILALQALTLLETLLLLGLLGVAGLILGLIETRGVSRLSESHLTDAALAELPGSIRDRLPNYAGAPERGLAPAPRLAADVPDTGLHALVATGRFSENPVQRAAAGVLGRVVRGFRPLQNNLGALQTLLIAGLVLLLATAMLLRLGRKFSARAAGRAARGLRHQIHRQTYRYGQSSLPTEGAGPVIDLFTRDVNDVRDGLIAELEITPRAPTLAAGLLLVALLISPILTVFVLSLAGLVWAVLIPLSRARQSEQDAAARESAAYLCLLHEDLGMIRTVRGYGMEGVDRRRFEEHLDSYQDADERRLMIEGRRTPTLLLLGGSAAIIAVGLLGYNVLMGRIGLVGAFILTASMLALFGPLAAWRDRRLRLQRAERAAEAIGEFLERRPELQMGVNAQFLPPLKERIAFENVSLDAPNGRPLLLGFSAEIPAGTRTAIMGFDEEAKHALACLIPRLIDPKHGRVRLDGIDLRDVTLESLRAQVSLVLQADLTFSDSVLNNIALGDESFGLPRIIEAAKIAHAHSFVQDLPRGYETVIGPMGHPLPLDQQFRIALARALLHDPSIVILEEPPDRLEDEVKSLIDDTIDRLSPGRTLIILPHRLSTIRKCDRVIILHNGRVETSGPPRELHTQSKLFRHLQYVEFNQFATGEIEAGHIG